MWLFLVWDNSIGLKLIMNTETSCYPYQKLDTAISLCYRIVKAKRINRMPIDCYFCGNQLKWLKRSDSTFCDDDCRMKFNNLRRKVDAQYTKISKAFKLMITIADDAPHLRQLTFNHIQTIKTLFIDVDLGSKYKCKDCGQLTYVVPYEWMECGLCGVSKQDGYEVVDHK